ncbi:hypothetical protein D3C79_696410 [compost metagenome]
MRQSAAVFVPRLDPGNQANLAATGLDQGLQALACGLGEGFTGATLATDFRCIDADQANAATIIQTQGIAVDHLTHADDLRIDGCRAERQGRQLPNRAHKKGAREGRLFQQQCQTHGASFAQSYFLAPNMPKRSANFCTRPPVSRTFCLPV